jgi:hypothetical protein
LVTPAIPIGSSQDDSIAVQWTKLESLWKISICYIAKTEKIYSIPQTPLDIKRRVAFSVDAQIFNRIFSHFITLLNKYYTDEVDLISETLSNEIYEDYDLYEKKREQLYRSVADQVKFRVTRLGDKDPNLAIIPLSVLGFQTVLFEVSTLIS